jgi:hypothetical protein
MRLNEQRDTLIEAVEDAGCDLIAMRSAILRKIAAPYGDGSKSNMVNAETDVLPRLNAILDTLATTLEAISRDPHAASQKQAEAVRIW